MIDVHRGCWSVAPENSRAAVAAAGHFDMVEVDVRLSTDGVPFLMHDPTLARTAGRPDAVADLGAAELAGIRLLDSDETVPSLADALAAGPASLYWDIDVKDAAELDTVARFLSARPERVRVMLKRDVHDLAGLEALRALEDRHGVLVIAKVILRDASDLTLVERIRDAGVAAAEIAFASADLAAAACATGLPVSVFTLDEIACDGFSDGAGLQDPAAVWGRLIDMGVRVLMTDAPQAVERHLRDRESRLARVRPAE